MRTTVTYLIAVSFVAGLAITLPTAELTAQGQLKEDQRLSTATPIVTLAQRSDTRENPPENTQVRQKAVVEAPVYVPPRRGAPSLHRRYGGGTRGGIGAPPAILALAPADHTALTLQEQPILYWFASSKIETPVELSLTDENGDTPEFEAKLESPIQAGIHPIRLADYKVRLAAGKRYRWSVALVFDPDRRSKDILTYGWIQRVEKTGQASMPLKGSTGGQMADLAKAGLWYDAVMAISRQIDATPTDRNLHRERAGLFNQVDLTAAAAYDKNLGK
ncbi:MAG: DUF928 domain-containing protein [Nitrospiraceae bacterium]